MGGGRSTDIKLIDLLIIIYIKLMESSNKFDEQADEVQVLESIFMDDFNLIEERPYKFEINIKAN